LELKQYSNQYNQKKGKLPMDEMSPNEINTAELNSDNIADTTSVPPANFVAEAAMPTDDISASEQTNIEATEIIPQISYSKPKSNTDITDEDFKWYCVRTYTSYEEKVKKILDAEVKRLGLGYCVKEVVVPVETVFEVRNGKKKTKLRNFLPGYVLVNAVISESKKTKKKLIDVVTDISGVVSFVGRRNDPTALQQYEVERIFSRINERAEVATMDTIYRQGDPIIVIAGPFEGFKGTVFEVINEKQKIKVEITILGRKTPVELGIDQVQFDKPE
jgi:transcriptional antiterminator NusG